mgnify:CR=1 FL=1
MFYIRVDANNKIATGHVMRCMSIADEIKNRNIDVCFLTADHNADVLLHKQGFITKCLDSKWDNLESEMISGKISSVLENDNNIKGILVDTYYVTEKYLDRLRKICKTIYIDDIFALHRYPVDFLLNYNIYGADLDYKSRCLPETKLLLGTKYVPLRKEFQNIKPKFRKRVKNVFISTGGTDNFNIAGKILDTIFKKSVIEKNSIFKEINYHVISGAMNKNLSYLLEISNKHNNIFIHQNVSNIAEIMSMCDIAISACGFTMYELCAYGLPIITYSFADNQLHGIRKFYELGVAINCGDVRDGIEKVVQSILDNVVMMCGDNVRRLGYSRNANALIDDKSIHNIVNIIMDSCLIREKYNLKNNF